MPPTPSSKRGVIEADFKRSHYIFPPYPDLGMHFWDTVPLPMRSVEMVLINCRPQALISGPEGGWDVQFPLDVVGEGRFLGTLHTKQSRDEIRAIMSGLPIASLSSRVGFRMRWTPALVVSGFGCFLAGSRHYRLGDGVDADVPANALAREGSTTKTTRNHATGGPNDRLLG